MKKNNFLNKIKLLIDLTKIEKVQILGFILIILMNMNFDLNYYRYMNIFSLKLIIYQLERFI